MSDHELDEMLSQWKAPIMRDSVRENLRAGFAARQPAAEVRQAECLPHLAPQTVDPAWWRRRFRLRFRRSTTSAAAARPESANRVWLLCRMMDQLPKTAIRRLAVATIGVAALLFAIIQVSPRTISMASPGFRIPYYVEFEFEHYWDGRSVSRQSRITSFPYGGHEIVMSVTQSGDSLLNTMQGIASAIRNQLILAVPSFVLPKNPPMAEPDWFAGFVSSGCSEGKNVVGHETVAGHETTVTQSEPPGYRLKVWMAPDLSCFALKVTQEIQAANGAYRLSHRKEAVKVTMNP